MTEILSVKRGELSITSAHGLPGMIVHIALEASTRHWLPRSANALIQILLHPLNLPLLVLQQALQITHVGRVLASGLVGTELVVLIVCEVVLELLEILLLLPNLIVLYLLLQLLIVLLLAHIRVLPLPLLAQATRAVHFYIFNYLN